jgi:oligopeptide transport system substrate-binding protein
MRRLLTPLIALLLASASIGAAAQAAEPKVIHYGRTSQFTSLDPVRQFDETSSDLVQMVYNPLLGYSYLERPYRLVPRLLTRLPELSADKLTYTFTLVKGVRFHDNKCFPGGQGRELTSDDVLYSIKRYADANLNSKSWFGMEGAVVGLDAYRAATAQAGPGKTDHAKTSVEGLKKIDNHRFSIKLTRPNPLFLYALTFSSTGIVPMEAVQMYGEQFGVNPVGTGPFTLANVERKGVLRFLKYPRYHGTYPTVGEPGDAEKGLLKAAGQKLPFVDVVEMPLIEEAQPAVLRFLKGELDWRGLDRANFTKMVSRNGDGQFALKPEFAARHNVYATLGLNTTYISINMKDPLLGKNKALRQALVHLYDTRGEIEVLLNGRARPLNSIVPYDMPGSERDTGAKGRGYDLAAAKKLLAEAGFPDGKGLPVIRVSYPATTVDQRNRFDFQKARFAAAGVKLEGVFADQPTMIRAVEGGNFQLADYGWVADYPDAENFYQLLYSKNVAPGPNYGSFAHAEYDRTYEAARLMDNGPERYKLFQRMNQILHDEAPVIITYNTLRFGVTQKWLLNFKRNVQVPEYEFLDVDMALKKKGF